MKNWIKYTIAFLGVLIVRLIPFRAPNLEPLLATQMPFAKKFGVISSFMFGVLSIALYDLITSGWGIWTLITALAYGLMGVGSYYFLKNRTGWKSYASYAIIATIVYDAVTGLTIGPLFFNQSFSVSVIGQIPFTLLHLLGNVSFAIILSPAIERWFQSEVRVKNEKLVVVC